MCKSYEEFIEECPAYLEAKKKLHDAYYWALSLLVDLKNSQPLDTNSTIKCLEELFMVLNISYTAQDVAKINENLTFDYVSPAEAKDCLMSLQNKLNKRETQE